MAQIARFFDAISYGEDDQADTQSRFRVTGILPEVGNRLLVTAPGGMLVRISDGDAMVEGFHYKNTSNLDLAIAANTSGSIRIDRVVLRLNRTSNTLTAMVIQGNPGDPMPALTQIVGGTWDHPLATITIPGGTTAAITSSMISLAHVYSTAMLPMINYIDVYVFGARTYKSPVENRIAIQAAIDYALSKPYGGTLLVSELYHIAGGVLNCVTGISTKSLHFIGIGEVVSGIIQDDSDTDVFGFGSSTYLYSALRCSVRNMTIQGGKYGLRLNNSQQFFCENVQFVGNQVGWYQEGSCELPVFKRVSFDGQANYGMSLGNYNGAPAGGLGWSYTQKGFFEFITMAISAGATSYIKITGSQAPGEGQITSALNTFDKVVLQGGPIGNTPHIDLTYNGQITFRQLSNEQVTPFTNDNQASFMLAGAGTSRVFLYDCHLAGRANQQVAGVYRHFKYIIEATYGLVIADNTTFGVADSAATADVYLAAGGTFRSCSMKDRNAILFANDAARAHSLMENCTGSDGNPITDWDTVDVDTPFIGGAGAGVNGGVKMGYVRATLMRPNTLQLGSGAELNRTGGTYVIASGATQAIGPEAAKFTIHDTNNRTTFEFATRGTGNSTNELVDPGAIFVPGATSDPGTGTTWVAYYDTTNATYVLKNVSAGSRTVRWEKVSFL